MCVCDKQHTHFLYFAERQENTSKGIVNTGKGDRIVGSDSEFEHNISAISKCFAVCTPISTAIIINTASASKVGQN